VRIKAEGDKPESGAGIEAGANAAAESARRTDTDSQHNTAMIRFHPEVLFFFLLQILQVTYPSIINLTQG